MILAGYYIEPDLGFAKNCSLLRGYSVPAKAGRMRPCIAASHSMFGRSTTAPISSALEELDRAALSELIPAERCQSFTKAIVGHAGSKLEIQALS